MADGARLRADARKRRRAGRGDRGRRNRQADGKPSTPASNALKGGALRAPVPSTDNVADASYERWPGSACRPIRRLSRDAHCTSGFALTDRDLPRADPRSPPLLRAAAARRRRRVAVRRRLAGAVDLRLRVPRHRALEPGHREIRRAGADLRHLVTSAIAMLIAVPSASASPSSSPSFARARCGARSASRSSCWPASPRSSTASGACSFSRRSCRRQCSPPDRHVRRRAGAVTACLPARPTASAC